MASHNGSKGWGCVCLLRTLYPQRKPETEPSLGQGEMPLSFPNDLLCPWIPLFIRRLWVYVSYGGPRKGRRDNWTGAVWEAGLPGSLDKQPCWTPVLSGGLMRDLGSPTAQSESEFCWHSNSDSGLPLPDDASKTFGFLHGVGMAFPSFCFCFPTHHCNVRAVFLLQHLELTYLYLPNTDTDMESMLSKSVGQSMPSSESVSPSVASDSEPMDCNPSRPLCPWDSPGQNTGVGSLSLLQGIFPAQGSNPGLTHCRQILYQLSHKGSP